MYIYVNSFYESIVDTYALFYLYLYLLHSFWHYDYYYHYYYYYNYKGYTIAIQDDYKYWHTHNESDESGKLLLIHTEDDCSSSNGDNNDDNNCKNNDKINNDNYNNDKKIDNNNKNIDNCYRNNIDKIQIFFDDNIERNRSHIVDVRDIKTFKHIPFNDIKNIYIKKIEPYYAIIDDNYYIDIVQEMVENQSSSHKD
jgi:hypothetical protein